MKPSADAVFCNMMEAELGGVKPQVLADNKRYTFGFDFKLFPVGAIISKPYARNLVGNRTNRVKLAHVIVDYNAIITVVAVRFDAAFENERERGNAV